MPPETWLPVLGWAGLYEVSSHGRVRSLDRTVTRSDGFTRASSGRVLRPSRTGRGRNYLHVMLRQGTRQETRKIHVLVCEAFKGGRPEGRVVRHLNGDSLDNRPDNLVWGTASENMFDRVTHGTHPGVNKAVCLRGHRLAGNNLRPAILRQGRRGCLSCKKAGDYLRTHPEADLKTVADEYFKQLEN